MTTPHRLLPLATIFLAATIAAFAAEEPATTETAPFDRDAIHEFTDETGRTIRAQIYAASPVDVSIRRDDGQTFRVPLETFSEADRKLVALWHTAEILNSGNQFEFEVSRFTEKPEETATKIAEITSTQMGYLITLRNRSPIPLRDLKVEYKVFKNMNLPGDSAGYPISKTGVELISVLAPRQSYEVRSATVSVAETRLQPGLIYLDGSDERQSDTLEGIWIRLIKDGQILAQFSRPTRLTQEATW